MNGFDDFDTQIQSDESDEMDNAEMYEIVPPDEDEMNEMFRFFHPASGEL